MRIYLQTSPTNQIVPFSYQHKLVGAFHKWLGHNPHHDALSLYSISGFEHTQASKEGLHFRYGARFHIGAANHDMIKQLIDGIMSDPTIAYGMEVTEVNLKMPPPFGSYAKFRAQTPIFIKRQVGDKQQFYYYSDPESDQFLTETLQHKLQAAGKGHLQAHVSFDRSYHKAKRDGFKFKGIHNIGSLCPVIVEGDPEAVAFAWSVGIGNGTGIGFGAVR